MLKFLSCWVFHSYFKRLSADLSFFPLSLLRVEEWWIHATSQPTYSFCGWSWLCIQPSILCLTTLWCHLDVIFLSYALTFSNNYFSLRYWCRFSGPWYQPLIYCSYIFLALAENSHSAPTCSVTNWFLQWQVQLMRVTLVEHCFKRFNFSSIAST